MIQVFEIFIFCESLEVGPNVLGIVFVQLAWCFFVAFFNLLGKLEDFVILVTLCCLQLIGCVIQGCLHRVELQIKGIKLLLQVSLSRPICQLRVYIRIQYIQSLRDLIFWRQSPHILFQIAHIRLQNMKFLNGNELAQVRLHFLDDMRFRIVTELSGQSIKIWLLCSLVHIHFEYFHLVRHLRDVYRLLCYLLKSGICKHMLHQIQLSHSSIYLEGQQFAFISFQELAAVLVSKLCIIINFPCEILVLLL